MPVTRKEILDEAIRCTTGQREQDYGSPEDNFNQIARLWNAYLEEGIKLTAVDVANMMILLKMARSMSGTHIDNWVDIAGYAACAGEIEASGVMETCG